MTRSFVAMEVSGTKHTSLGYILCGWFSNHPTACIVMDSRTMERLCICQMFHNNSSDLFVCLADDLSTGLSPDLNDFDQIRSIARPTDVPDTGLLCDLLWSDPDKDMQGWGENDRGVSFTFGSDIVTKFLNRHDLDLICRAHQVTYT